MAEVDSRMARMPAFCPQCGAVYPSGIAASNVTNMRIQNVTSVCPRCGARGSVPDGRYNVVREVIQLLGGPESSYERLSRYYEIITEAQNRAREPEEALDEVSARLPDVGEWLSRHLPKHRQWLLGALCTALGILLSMQVAYQTSGPTSQEIEDAFFRALQRHAEAMQSDPGR